jgi:hypothetical protein
MKDMVFTGSLLGPPVLANLFIIGFKKLSFLSRPFRPLVRCEFTGESSLGDTGVAIID